MLLSTIVTSEPVPIIQPTPITSVITETPSSIPTPFALTTVANTPAPPITATAIPTHYPDITLPKGPYLIFTGNNTEMEVIWQLDKKIPSILEWGTTLQYSVGSITTQEYTTDHMHRYIIQDLTPGIKYYYRVRVGDGESGGTFIAAPESTATDLNFFVYGDTRDGTVIHDQIAGRIASIFSLFPAFQSFILDTGDLVSDGNLDWMWNSQLFDPKYRNIRKVFASVAFIPVMGNHEGNGSLFVKYFPIPFVGQRYWSFDYGPSHIILLDQFTPYEEGTEQYIWLKNDLASSGKTWKFIVMHIPGWSASENNIAVQRSIVALSEQYGVSIIFAGNNHYYARAEVNGVTHITAGGGGAPLYVPNPHAPNIITASRTHSYIEISIHEGNLDGTAYDVDGNVIDQFSISK